MSISHNRFLAGSHRLRAFVTGQRPIAFERRLIREVRALTNGDRLLPSQAWRIYCDSMRRPSFTDSGWLVQYGVYDFSGPEWFMFSLVRQFNALEHWNDEYIQLDLRLEHEPTQALRALGRWNSWSFGHPNLRDFQAHCERQAGVQAILADGSADWRWHTGCEGT